MTKQKQTSEPWPEYRWKQLAELQALLQDCEAIDHANCILARLARIIEWARALNNSDRDLRQASFVQFIQQLAIQADAAAEPPAAGELCGHCNQRYTSVYRVPDELWAEVTGRADGGGLLCMTCCEAKAGKPIYWEGIVGAWTPAAGDELPSGIVCPKCGSNLWCDKDGYRWWQCGSKRMFTARGLDGTICEHEVCLRRQIDTAIAANVKLRQALEACDVSMDTAAMHNLPQKLPPAYRDSWAAAHRQAQAALAESTVQQ